MELYLLRTFVTVAEQGHLTKAATLLHVSQPAVSGQVKALEEALGLRLFERSPTGVRLTKAGEALLPRARSALAAAAEFTTSAKKLAGHLTGKARVGTILDPASSAWVRSSARCSSTIRGSTWNWRTGSRPGRWSA